MEVVLNGCEVTIHTINIAVQMNEPDVTHPQQNVGITSVSNGTGKY